MPTCVTTRGKPHSPKGSLVYKRKIVFLATGEPFLRRPRTADLSAARLDRKESTGNQPAASLGLALAPWPARRVPNVGKKSSHPSVSAGPTSRRVTGSAKQSSSKKKMPSIPYIFSTKNCLLYEIRNSCTANSTLPHAHVEREAQATRSSAKRGQLRPLFGPLRPTGGTVPERCCISVVVQ